MELAKRIGEDIDALKDIFLNIGVLLEIPIQHSRPFYKILSKCYFLFFVVCVALEVPNVLKPQCSMKRSPPSSNEIVGDGDIPHPGIGNARRMQVPNVNMQHKVMTEAVENHMPETIVIDEIGTELEALAASTISQS
ncbi:hypothetical protein SUGI_0668930 [Cryptomeria japonica]|nr:hypothetical protein SUGI_0668930 [Cryptomeria japonica]